MRVVGLRERKKLQTREAIVATALALFAERGFERVTVEEIAASCDVSPRTFFRYFPAKEDVLLADIDGRQQRLLEAIDSQPPDLTPLRVLRAAVFAVAEDYEDERERILLRHRVIVSTPLLWSRAVERHHHWELAIIDALRRSGHSDELDDLELRLVVASATTALRVAAEVWIESGGDSDLRALLARVFDHLGAGLE
jgi:AcrR family transcriptional regulator